MVVVAVCSLLHVYPPMVGHFAARASWRCGRYRAVPGLHSRSSLARPLRQKALRSLVDRLCCGFFFGVVLVVRPPFLFGGIPANSDVGAGSVSLGTCLNILAAAFGALTNVLVKFAPEAHFLEVQHCTDFMCGVVLCPPLLLAFGTPSVLANLAVQESILIVAAFGVGGLCLVILGYQLGNPGRIAVVSYLEVPCAYVAQVVLFGNAVEWPAILGSFLIVAAAFAVVTEKDEAN